MTTRVISRPLKSAIRWQHPLPSYSEVRSALREVRRVERLRSVPLGRGAVEWAYDLALDQEKDRLK